MKDNHQVPLVSVCITTYNHEKYVKQAVDSVLNQHMKFKYELIIADDASTDNTQLILRENYSNIENIKLILREKNSKGRNLYLAIQETKGQYIYHFDGDDFCIGTDSLQVLVEWLEEHREYIGVAARRVTLSEKTGYMSITYDKKSNNQEITLEDFTIREKGFDVCAILYKNFYRDGKYDYRYYLACPMVGDVTLALYMLLHGKIFQLDKNVGVYRTDRVANSGAYNVIRTPKDIFEDHIKLLMNLEKCLGIKIELSGLKRFYASWYVNSLKSLYEFMGQLPYICKMVGIRIAIECISIWVKKKKRR